MKFIWFIVFIFLLSFMSCEPKLEDDTIPFAMFNNIEINLTHIQYSNLNTIGYVEIEGGLKGIILYKDKLNNTYTAFERNCSYKPTSDCAKVEVDGSTLFMIDTCCQSQFSFEGGIPISGPATFPLRRYATVLNGNILIITDTPL